MLNCKKKKHQKIIIKRHLHTKLGLPLAGNLQFLKVSWRVICLINQSKLISKRQHFIICLSPINKHLAAINFIVYFLVTVKNCGA